MVEASNHAIGADTHRKMLLSGCMNGAAMLSSLLLTKSPVFNHIFEDIASHFNSGHCLSLLHMRNCPIAFTGKLQFD
jgi:hypothetical protein